MSRRSSHLYPRTDVLVCRLFSAGQCEAPSRPWATYCCDVTGAILSKLSLHDLAHVAGTCREFRTKCLVRVTYERNRLLSAAEETFGTGMVSGFVSAFQNSLHEEGGYTPFPLGQTMVTAAGQVEHLPGGVDIRERCATDGHVGTIGGIGDSPMRGRIHQGVPGSPWPACIFSVCSGRKYQGGMQICAGAYEAEGATAAMGLLLAICARNPEAMPASWQDPLSTASLGVHGLEGDWDADADGVIGAFGSALPTPSPLSPFFVTDPENPGVFKLLRICW
jgi:hypothetical protein